MLPRSIKTRESLLLVQTFIDLLNIEINFFFALIGFPLAFVIALYSGEIYYLTDILAIEDLNHRFWFIFSICFSGMMGIVITLSILLVCTLASPVATNITGKDIRRIKRIIGTVKDVVLTYIGFVFFDGVHLTMNVLTGLGLSFMGAIAYGWD